MNDRYIWMVHELCDAFTRKPGDECSFDLDADPDERNNLAERPGHQELIAGFRGHVLKWWKQAVGGALQVERESMSQ